jgi:transcription elongation factor GreA
MQRVPMTVAGAAKLRDELEHLRQVMRPQISKEISEARAHGDLSENAEYHAAKEKQGLVEARIREIEGRLALAQVIDVKQLDNTGKVMFGATVTLFNLGTQEEVTYQIVGDEEAELKDGKISINSPVARALIGKHEGDSLVVHTPGGEVDYEISLIQYI